LPAKPHNPNDPSVPSAADLADVDYQALAGFRLQIRRFLHFSEEAARSEGLEPQQHQFLLTVRALTGSYGPTIGEIAGHLLIRHHSAVGLADRLVEHRLVKRVRGNGDRRQVRIRLTAQGKNMITRLSGIHRAEILNSGPLLVESLGALLRQLRKKPDPRRHKEDNVPKAQHRNP
jgi:DNA-binding MarR family transcriptional regulator